MTIDFEVHPVGTSRAIAMQRNALRTIEMMCRQAAIDDDPQKWLRMIAVAAAGHETANPMGANDADPA